MIRQAKIFLLIYVPVTLLISLLQTFKVSKDLYIYPLPLSQVIKLSFLSFFISSVFSLPFASVISTFAGTGWMNEEREIIAMSALGASKSELIVWLLAFPALTTVLSITVNSWFAPLSFSSLKKTLVYTVSSNIEEIVKNAKNFPLSDNIALSYDPSSDKFVMGFYGGGTTAVVSGKSIESSIKGEYIQVDISGASGIMYSRRRAKDFIQFSGKSLSIMLSLKKLFPRAFSYYLLDYTLWDLLKAWHGKNTPAYIKTEFWKRLAIGLSPLMLGITAIWAAFFFSETWKDRGLLFMSLIFISFYILTSLGKKVGYTGIFTPAPLALSVLTGIPFGYMLWKRKTL